MPAASVGDPTGQWADLSNVEDHAVINFGDLPNNLVLNVDGTLRGNDGCNSFSGTWALDNGVIQFTQTGGTEVACADTGADAFPDFGTIAFAVADVDTLHLLGADGAAVGTLPRVTYN